MVPHPGLDSPAADHDNVHAGFGGEEWLEGTANTRPNATDSWDDDDYDGVNIGIDIWGSSPEKFSSPVCYSKS